MKEQYEAMKLWYKYMYEAGSGAAAVEKVMTTGSISGMLTQAEYTQQVHTYDLEKLQEYADTVQKVEISLMYCTLNRKKSINLQAASISAF